jgi:hypothetical protein
MPSKEFYIRECADLTLTFKGNIDFYEQTPPVTLTFTASMQTARLQGFVKVVDEFRQRGRDDYVGMLQFWSSNDSDNIGQVSYRKQSTSGMLLGELPISLPKVSNKSSMLCFLRGQA